jgi:hypothetical protein
VASGSRTLDPIGRIWCALRFVNLAALLRWQELRQERKKKPGISCNKAVLPFFSKLVDMVFHRGARRSPEKIFVRLAWWKPGARSGSGEASFNKRSVDLFFFWRSTLLLSLLAGLGGEEKGKLAAAPCSSGGDRGSCDTACVWRSSSVAQDWLPTLDAGRQQLQSLTTALRQEFINLLRRPFVGLATTLDFFTAPSGSVPGAVEDGRRLRPVFTGGVGGPVCRFSIQSRVCAVIVRDLCQIVFFLKVLIVKCTAALDN